MQGCPGTAMQRWRVMATLLQWLWTALPWAVAVGTMGPPAWVPEVHPCPPPAGGVLPYGEGSVGSSALLQGASWASTQPPLALPSPWRSGASHAAGNSPGRGGCCNRGPVLPWQVLTPVCWGERPMCPPVFRLACAPLCLPGPCTGSSLLLPGTAVPGAARRRWRCRRPLRRGRLQKQPSPLVEHH